jgi:hypothetical protein
MRISYRERRIKAVRRTHPPDQPGSWVTQPDTIHESDKDGTQRALCNQRRAWQSVLKSCISLSKSKLGSKI